MSSDDDLDISEVPSTDGSDNGSDLEGFVTDTEQEEVWEKITTKIGPGTCTPSSPLLYAVHRVVE